MTTQNNSPKTLGQKLKELRKHHQLTQESVSEQLFVSRQAISNWEQDKEMRTYSMLSLKLISNTNDRKLTHTSCPVSFIKCKTLHKVVLPLSHLPFQSSV